MPYAGYGHNVYKCYYCSFVAWVESGTAWTKYQWHLRQRHPKAALWRQSLAQDQELPVRW